MKDKVYINILYSLEKPREKMQKTSNLSIASASTTLSPKVATKKKVPKGNKSKDSGTSSEEERWLDAIESGKLEEVSLLLHPLQISFLCHKLNIFYLRLTMS